MNAEVEKAIKAANEAQQHMKNVMAELEKAEDQILIAYGRCIATRQQLGIADAKSTRKAEQLIEMLNQVTKSAQSGHSKHKIYTSQSRKDQLEFLNEIYEASGTIFDITVAFRKD